MVNSASDYASGPLEPKPLAVSPPRALTSSVRGFTLVDANNRLGPFVAAFRALRSMTGYQPVGKRIATALPHTVVNPAGLSPTAFHYKRKALGGILAMGLPCLELPPEHRSVPQSALAYAASLTSNQTTLPDISSHPGIPVGIHRRLVKPLTAEAIPD